MKPLTGILLATGALTAAVAAAIYEATRSAPVASTAAGAKSPALSFTAGLNYTVTVTLASPLTGDSTQGSVQTALGGNFNVGPNISATPSSISYTVDALANVSVPSSTLATAAAAIPNSPVTATMNGPSQTTAGAKPPINVKSVNLQLTIADSGTSISLNVADNFTVSLAGSGWTYSLNGPNVTHSASTTSGGMQVDTFTATSSGTTIVSASGPNGGTFNLTANVA